MCFWLDVPIAQHPAGRQTIHVQDHVNHDVTIACERSDDLTHHHPVYALWMLRHDSMPSAATGTQSHGMPSPGVGPRSSVSFPATSEPPSPTSAPPCASEG